MEKILAQAAEAIIIKSGSSIIKRRISKGYRLKEIDEKLRKGRTRSEAKIMEKLQGKINVPKIIRIDEKSKEITMEFILGLKLSEHLNDFPIEKQLEICKEIGKEVAKIHGENLIHGDLTTSNMILQDNKQINKSNKEKKKVEQDCENSLVNNNTEKGSKQHKNEKNSESINNINNFRVFFIDFGLGFHSSKIEDKAVDIHLLKQALEAKHFSTWKQLFKEFIENYNPIDKDKIIKQFDKVELRGRYKH